MNLDINKRIREYRMLRGYTRADVAEKLNMKLSTYSKTERNGTIYCDMLIKLSEILDVSADTLLLGYKRYEPKYTPNEIFAINLIGDLPDESKKAVYEFVNQRSKNIKI